MEEVIIQHNDANQRLDKFLGKAYPNLKKSAMYKAIRNKKIKVNRKRASFDQVLQEGDHILLFLPPDFLEKPKKVLQSLPAPQIVFENDQLVAMNKPAGLLSMKDSPQNQDTLNDRLLSYLQSSGQYDPNQESSFTPSIAHRLDRNTSGLVLAGKNAPSSRRLAQAIANHTIRKYYLAITDQKPIQGEVTLYLKKEGTKSLVSNRPLAGYDSAQMAIHTIGQANGRYLSEIELYTGRFHQIRACLAFLGTPLLGDVKYGGAPYSKGYALQAYKIDLSQAGFERIKTIELPPSEQLHL
ncbi:MAG: RluA family pseudouridine synthase [Allobaculum sp.]|nr:RluA family pseudouridine synthase [Allobaculum sp.]